MKGARIAFDVLVALFGLLFLFAVAVQYNDPDPLRWMAIYAAAAATCALWLFRKLPLWLPVATGVVALLWALDWGRTAWGGPSFFSLFEHWEMKSVPIEEAREMWGLLIVAGWCAVMSVAAVLRRRNASRAG